MYYLQFTLKTGGQGKLSYSSRLQTQLPLGVGPKMMSGKKEADATVRIQWYSQLDAINTGSTRH